MKDEWIPHTEIDWNDKTILLYNIDTRDFHCAQVRAEGFSEEEGCNPRQNLNLSKLVKYKDRFFHTSDEAKETIARLFTESGGAVEWRMIWFTGEGNRLSENWNMKYFRIHRTEHGLLICHNKHYALSKQVLSCKMNEEFLNAH